MCDGVDLPKLTQVGRAYLSHAQVSQRAVAVGADGDIVRFLAYTGPRRGEMAALTVGRVDCARRRLEVADAVSDPRGLLVWSTSKTHERRTVAFPALLVRVLQADAPVTGATRWCSREPTAGCCATGTDGSGHASLFDDDMESVAVSMDRMAARESVPDLCPVPLPTAKHMLDAERTPR